MDTAKPVCGLDIALAVIGGELKPLILYHLQGGPTRFGELKRRGAGVSEEVLIQLLRKLVAAGMLIRRDHQRVPPMVDYAMTPAGLTWPRRRCRSACGAPSIAPRSSATRLALPQSGTRSPRSWPRRY